MKTCKKCGETKARSEFYADSHYHDGLKSSCKACSKSASLRWASENPDRTRTNKSAWVAENKDANRSHQRKYRSMHKEVVAKSIANWEANNPEKKEAGRKRWRERNRERYLLACRYAGRSWRVNNRGAVNAKTARRRAVIHFASVAWADGAAVKAFYDEAVRTTIESGIPHQVDHVVPLQSPFVCGLHNEFNLRVITALENQKKHNSVTHLIQRQSRMFA